VVTAFTIPATASSLIVSVSSFTASDNKAVTGFILTESATAPLAVDAGWSATAPTSYTFATEGTKTLYAYAKDAAGNISTSANAQVVITLPVTSTNTTGNTEVFSLATSSKERRAMPVTFSEAGQIQSISVYHNAGTGDVLLGVYSDLSGRPSSLLGVTPSTAVRSTPGWQTVSLTTPVNVTSGQKVWLAWVFENTPFVRYQATATPESVSTIKYTWSSGMPSTFGSNFNANFKFSVYCTFTTSAISDITKPTVTAFTIPATSSSLTAAVSSFTATDNTAVTGYILTESSAAPLAGNAGWTAAAPTSYTFASEGTKTLYAWAKDAAGNVSTSANAQVIITLPVTSTNTTGNTEVFSLTTSSKERRAMPVTFSEAGQIQSISVYHNAGTGNVLLGVYSDLSGRPSSLLGVTPSTAVRSTPGWQTVSLTTPVNVTSGQKVWLAWVFENTPYIRYQATATPGSVTAPGSTWSSAMPSTFGTNWNANFKFSVYCTYTTTKSAEIATAVTPVGEFADLKVYPNPFSDKLRFEFVSPESVNARIDLYDMTGRMVKTIFEQPVEGGVSYEADFKPNSVISGMYFYHIVMGKTVYNGKVIFKKD
jgi:chorismate mutase